VLGVRRFATAQLKLSSVTGIYVYEKETRVNELDELTDGALVVTRPPLAHDVVCYHTRKALSDDGRTK